MTASEEMVWHKDGHSVSLRINRSDLSIYHIHCPGHEDRQCNVGKFECVVRHFLETYGLDCNVGTCDASPILELAWSGIGDFDDPDNCQIWVIPVDDEAFAAWLVTQSS